MSKPAANPSLLKNSAAAPVVYFDGCPAAGHLNGVVQIELAASTLLPRADDSVGVEVVCAAHLRCSLAAAQQLRDTIDNALKMAMKPPVKLAS